MFAGLRHPELLGSRVREGWDEVAAFNDNVMRRGLAGEILSYRDQELILHRQGRAEQVWMNLDYSPLLDDAGEPVGVMAIVVETTAKVMAERHLQQENERLARLFEQAPSFMTLLSGPSHRIELANPAYLQLVGHRPLFGLPIAQALPDAAAQGYVELLDNVYRSGEAYAARGARYATQMRPGGQVQDRFVDFVFQPIRNAEDAVTGIFVEGVRAQLPCIAGAEETQAVEATRAWSAVGPRDVSIDLHLLNIFLHRGHAAASRARWRARPSSLPPPSSGICSNDGAAVFCPDECVCPSCTGNAGQGETAARSWHPRR